MECLWEEVHIAHRFPRKHTNITLGGCSPILPPPFQSDPVNDVTRGEWLCGLLARPGPMTEKQNQGIQNEKRVQQCVVGLALRMGWVHGHCVLRSAPASSIA